jgi:hypothetical protein
MGKGGRDRAEAVFVTEICHRIGGTIRIFDHEAPVRLCSRCFVVVARERWRRRRARRDDRRQPADTRRQVKAGLATAAAFGGSRKLARRRTPVAGASPMRPCWDIGAGAWPNARCDVNGTACPEAPWRPGAGAGLLRSVAG